MDAQQPNQNIKVVARQHDSYGTFTVIAVLFPLVGVVLGIAYLTKDKPVDKKLGEHLLAMGIAFMLIWPLLLFVLYSLNGLRGM